MPAFVSTLCICIVFVPMFFLTGVARYLFVPLAEAVVFAMLASYLLSRTLVPTLAKYLLRGACRRGSRRGLGAGPEPESARAFPGAVRAGFERLRAALPRPARPLSRTAAVCSWSSSSAPAWLSLGLLVPWLGQDFFPSVDSGQFKLHLRARTGTRIEETARLCDQVEQASSGRSIPAGEIDSIIDNIGLPYSGINLSYSNSAPIGPADADILVSLREGRPTDGTSTICGGAARAVPRRQFSFLPADIVSQILNFGLPAPIDVQVVGNGLDGEPRGRRQAAHPDCARCRASSTCASSSRSISRKLHLAVDRTGRPGRPHPARRRQQPADLAERQLPDGADSGSTRERRQLSDRDADAAVP